MQPQTRTDARSRFGVLIVFMLVIGVLVAVVPVAAGQQDIPEPEAAAFDTGYVTVELKEPAAVHYTGGTKNLRGTAPKNGKRFRTDSRAYARYVRHLEKKHLRFEQNLAAVAPDAVIVEHFYATANAVVIELNGTNPAVLEGIKGARSPRSSGLVSMDMTDSRDLIGSAIGGVNSTGYTGAGVKVGIIDSGIINSLIPGFHPFFNCKAVEFGGVYYSGATGLPAYSLPPQAEGEPNPPGTPYIYYEPHGTHVAGTVGGCDYTFTGGVWSGQSMSGVAPGVELWDFNVFPGWGAGYVAFGGSAFSHDIANAIEDATVLGMDVINMSLGGGVQGPHDFLQEVSDSAVDAGVVVVTSAGNEGPGFFTVGSPGTGHKVIATAASTNSRGMGVKITIDSTDYYAVPGEFADFGGLDYTLADWAGATELACYGDELAPGTYSGEVVLVKRGDCAFSEKAELVKAAGGSGMVVYNHTGAAIAMARTDGYDDDIPAVMVSETDGAIFEGLVPITATITPPVIVPTTANELADFSSWGPAPFTNSVKPDVMAPGVDILSSTFTGFELYNGTSMASPHVAGAAALILEANGDWMPYQVKSAIVTTASDQGNMVWQQGGGLLDVPAAIGAGTWFEPANASFGIFKGNKPANGSVDIAITGAGGCEVTGITEDQYISDIYGPFGGTFASAAVSGNVLTVDFAGERSAWTDLYSGYVSVSCDDGDYDIPWGAYVRR